MKPNYDCASCNSLQKRERGCDSDTRLSIKFDGEEIWRCPRRPFLESPDYFDAVFHAWRTYMKGHLPDEGAFESQGHRFVQLMLTMETAVEDAKAELQRRT